MSDMICELVDHVFFPEEVGIILDAAVRYIPLLRTPRFGKIYPENILRLLPELCWGDESRANVIALLFNDMVDNW